MKTTKTLNVLLYCCERHLKMGDLLNSKYNSDLELLSSLHEISTTRTGRVQWHLLAKYDNYQTEAATQRTLCAAYCVCV